MQTGQFGSFIRFNCGERSRWGLHEKGIRHRLFRRVRAPLINFADPPRSRECDWIQRVELRFVPVELRESQYLPT
jgi:hypothetical protein